MSACNINVFSPYDHIGQLVVGTSAPAANVDVEVRIAGSPAANVGILNLNEGPSNFTTSTSGPNGGSAVQIRMASFVDVGEAARALGVLAHYVSTNNVATSAWGPLEIVRMIQIARQKILVDRVSGVTHG